MKSKIREIERIKEEMETYEQWKTELPTLEMERTQTGDKYVVGSGTDKEGIKNKRDLFFAKCHQQNSRADIYFLDNHEQSRWTKDLR